MAANRLIREKSPYLLQHAHNPVDWHPWSDEAFDRARREDKPVFLSIGYATCHWCHVMERESFEDPEAARRLNDTFVCIKVDREERPDIDTVYMTACQMLTGSGGWPLTILLTPGRKPFFAGTYMPKSAGFGRPGVLELCTNVHQLWDADREKILASARAIETHLAQAFERLTTAGEDLDATVLDRARAVIAESFDADHGGFESAPKFPSPHRLLFLLRVHDRTGDRHARQMVARTLTAMRLGGIHDHVGFGFHRYSTDARWLLPHFEKMLYDQALLLLAYVGGFQATGDPLFAATARELVTYVLRDMTSPEGAFFSAEDADSEGEEGRFYVWTTAQWRDVLGDAEARRWIEPFGLTEEGNYVEEATRRRTGANIPHLTRSLDAWADALGTGRKALAADWERARRRLLVAREKRMRPLRDDKVLTDWNGWMIAALATAARVLAEPTYAEAAARAAAFIRRRMTGAGGRLMHRFRDGEVAVPGMADDYAALIGGLIELHRAQEGDADYLQWALELQERMITDFWDTDNGGFFSTGESAGDLPVRPKEVTDGAMPSANSTALSNLVHLARMTGDIRWHERAGMLMRAVAGTVRAQPTAFTHLLSGVDLALCDT